MANAARDKANVAKDRQSQTEPHNISTTHSLRRRSVLRLAALGFASTIGFQEVQTAGAQSENAIPAGPVQYRIDIAGQTDRGEFARPGDFYVFPTLDVSGANFDNGVNARDIGLLSGNPSATPEQGAIWFATNNGAFDLMGLQTTTGDALIDVAFVEVDEATGVIGIALDPNATPTVHLNTMNARGGLTANVYQLLEGAMHLQFTNAGQEVVGEIQFIGNGFIEPGTSPYQARFEGVVAG